MAWAVFVHFNELFSFFYIFYLLLILSLILSYSLRFIAFISYFSRRSNQFTTYLYQALLQRHSRGAERIDDSIQNKCLQLVLQNDLAQPLVTYLIHRQHRSPTTATAATPTLTTNTAMAPDTSNAAEVYQAQSIQQEGNLTNENDATNFSSPVANSTHILSNSNSSSSSSYSYDSSSSLTSGSSSSSIRNVVAASSSSSLPSWLWHLLSPLNYDFIVRCSTFSSCHTHFYCLIAAFCAARYFYILFGLHFGWTDISRTRALAAMAAPSSLSSSCNDSSPHSSTHILYEQYGIRWLDNVYQSDIQRQEVDVLADILQLSTEFSLYELSKLFFALLWAAPPLLFHSITLFVLQSSFTLIHAIAQWNTRSQFNDNNNSSSSASHSVVGRARLQWQHCLEGHSKVFAFQGLCKRHLLILILVCACLVLTVNDIADDMQRILPALCNYISYGTAPSLGRHSSIAGVCRAHLADEWTASAVLDFLHTHISTPSYSSLSYYTLLNYCHHRLLVLYLSMPTETIRLYVSMLGSFIVSILYLSHIFSLFSLQSLITAIHYKLHDEQPSLSEHRRYFSISHTPLFIHSQLLQDDEQHTVSESSYTSALSLSVQRQEEERRRQVIVADAWINRAADVASPDAAANAAIETHTLSSSSHRMHLLMWTSGWQDEDGLYYEIKMHFGWLERSSEYCALLAVLMSLAFFINSLSYFIPSLFFALFSLFQSTYFLVELSTLALMLYYTAPTYQVNVRVDSRPFYETYSQSYRMKTVPRAA